MGTELLLQAESTAMCERPEAERMRTEIQTCVLSRTWEVARDAFNW